MKSLPLPNKGDPDKSSLDFQGTKLEIRIRSLQEDPGDSWIVRVKKLC